MTNLPDSPFLDQHDNCPKHTTTSREWIDSNLFCPKCDKGEEPDSVETRVKFLVRKAMSHQDVATYFGFSTGANKYVDEAARMIMAIFAEERSGFGVADNLVGEEMENER